MIAFLIGGTDGDLVGAHLGDVTAALGRSAVETLKDYLKWRGALHERDEPLFLTPRKKPYKDNERRWGTPNNHLA